MISFECLRCQRPYIYDVHMEVEWGSFEICHVFADSVIVKRKIYC